MSGRIHRFEQIIDTVMSSAYPTYASQKEWLMQLGVVGAAAEMVLKLLAPARRDARNALVHKAAQECAIKAIGDSPYILHAVSLIGALDQAGVGGTCGVTGSSTRRHPAFAHCGSGRKRAQDGQEWNAAIAVLPAGAEFLPTNDIRIMVVVGSIGVAFPVGNSVVPAEWARAFAVQRLMQSLHSPVLASKWADIVNFADRLFQRGRDVAYCHTDGVEVYQPWVQELLVASSARPASVATRHERPHRGKLTVA